MKEIHLITIGKHARRPNMAWDSSLLALEKDYLKRITRPKIKIKEIKAKGECPKDEGQSILKYVAELLKLRTGKGNKLNNLILLSECGKKFNSPEFSHWLYNFLEKNDKLIFVIGGSKGHSRELVDTSSFELSLSPLTFPHKLTRTILLEQIYRAQTIYYGHPYHK